MNKTELNQKFEKLNAQVNALWDSSKSLQDQSAEYKQAWQARFEVSRELRNFRSLSGDKCRLHDLAFKLQEQNA
tara:strand:- start:208 stop:429 length:222 start_codon:yes stop_codon:yes gene_type:complete